MPKPGGDPSSGISLGDVLRLPKRHPACRRREAQPGTCTERENLIGDAKGKGASGSNREAESTDAPGRGGLLRSSDEAGVMTVERRERAIAIWLGSTGNGRNPMFNGRRQPSRGGTSRMTRECQVRFCEGLGVKFPGPTRPGRVKTPASNLRVEAFSRLRCIGKRTALVAIVEEGKRRKQFCDRSARARFHTVWVKSRPPATNARCRFLP